MPDTEKKIHTFSLSSYFFYFFFLSPMRDPDRRFTGMYQKDCIIVESFANSCNLSHHLLEHLYSASVYVLLLVLIVVVSELSTEERRRFGELQYENSDEIKQISRYRERRTPVSFGRISPGAATKGEWWERLRSLIHE